ncbi:four helix bundle protein [Gracilimonas halophila]|uniref:Four helix bundle protein n=2 Tax=Gracilimonas halophila TaxID=1834464 RepID=A0ABW5JIS8_9BACT
MMMKNQGPIYIKSFEFAISIIKLYKSLTGCNEFVISKQLLRSGTAIGANVNEATAAESRNDFKHKMSIASKEARETLYWLRLLKEGELVDLKIDHELADCIELVKILTSIVKTTTKNSTQKN